MRAAYMPRSGIIEVGDFPLPHLAEGEVLVQMHYASICGSDVHIVFDGFHNVDSVGKPGYPGHEGVGVVVASKSQRFALGAPLLTVPSGQSGGCFAEFQVVDERHLVLLPTINDLIKFLMAQQLGTTIFALKKFCQGPSGTAGIIGAGPAGLFFLQLLLARGYKRVLISDVNAERLKIAEELGAEAVQVPNLSFVAEMHAATEGRGADLVIEAAGPDSCRAYAIDAVRAHGTVGCFGYAEQAGLSPFPVLAAFRKSATVSWVSGAQAEAGLASFNEAVRLIDRGEINVDFCLQHVVPLEDAARGFAKARSQGQAVKIVVDVSLSRAQVRGQR